MISLPVKAEESCTITGQPFIQQNSCFVSQTCFGSFTRTRCGFSCPSGSRRSYSCWPWPSDPTRCSWATRCFVNGSRVPSEYSCSEYQDFYSYIQHIPASGCRFPSDSDDGNSSNFSCSDSTRIKINALPFQTIKIKCTQQ